MRYEVFLVLVFLLFLAVDILFPFRKRTQSTLMRWASNYGIYLTNWVMGRLFTAASIVIFSWVTEGRYGLFNMIEVHPLLIGVICFLAIDLMDYGEHRLMHRWNWFWRIHRVHHSDRDYDLTTGLRFHPFEDFISSCLELSLILLLGIPLEVYVFYAFLLAFINFFVHSNIALSPGINRLLSMVFITPNLHRVHHSLDASMYDTNFGVILSLWDRLFGTMKQVAEQDQIHTGVREFDQPGELSYLPLMAMPFKGSDSRAPSRATSSAGS